MRFLKSIKRKSVLVFLLVAVSYVGSLFCFWLKVKYEPGEYEKREMAIERAVARIQAEIDKGKESENDIEVIYYKGDSALIKEVRYYLNNNEDREDLIPVLGTSKYIFKPIETPAISYSEVVVIGDFEIDITLYPVIRAGYYFELILDSYFRRIFPEIGDAEKLKEYINR